MTLYFKSEWLQTVSSTDSLARVIILLVSPEASPIPGTLKISNQEGTAAVR
jgi:hypothetical protein